MPSDTLSAESPSTRPPSKPNGVASHPPQLMPALPLPARRSASFTRPKMQQRTSTVRARRPSNWSHGPENSKVVSHGTDASDEESDAAEDEDDDDDDDAYVTSNDYATTPERRGGASPAMYHDPKGKGKARADPGTEATGSGRSLDLPGYGSFRDAS